MQLFATFSVHPLASCRPCINTRPTLLWMKREGPTCSLQILIQPEHFMCIRKQSLVECCRFNSLIALWEVRQIQIPHSWSPTAPPPPTSPKTLRATLRLRNVYLSLCIFANQSWVGVESTELSHSGLFKNVLSCEWKFPHFPTFLSLWTQTNLNVKTRNSFKANKVRW